jgi:hypothetical protein
VNGVFTCVTLETAFGFFFIAAVAVPLPAFASPFTLSGFLMQVACTDGRSGTVVSLS